MTAPPTDVDLVGAFMDGDSAAFDELFKRYHERIRRFCLRVTGDDATADDMVQDTFCKVIRSLDSVDGTFNFNAWIHRIAQNVCTDELRRRQRRLRRQEQVSQETTEDLILRLPSQDSSGDPEAALETQRLRRLVWDVGRRLPERQRLVLSMRELQGLPYASIARFMNTSESAVETLLHRARRRFREEFLLLEGPQEAEGLCAVVVKLVRSVGRDKLQAAQRDMVEEHLDGCTWCREMVAS